MRGARTITGCEAVLSGREGRAWHHSSFNEDDMKV